MNKTSIPIKSYAELLKQGNLVVFPTETVYGLGASAWNPKAVQEIFATKGRPSDNPLIVHISSIDMVKQFTDQVPGRARTLMQKFWPGPLTLVFRKKPDVLDIVTAGLSTVALRMPDHPIALQLIQEAGPLVAPSANKSGRPSPTRAEHVISDYGSSLPLIDGGECDLGLESTVLDLSVNPPVILRPGYITPNQIEEACGFRPALATQGGEDDTAAPRSPGMKYTHYSPKARVHWLGEKHIPLFKNSRDNTSKLLILHSVENPVAKPRKGLQTTHFKKDYRRFARELYDCFRKADIDNISDIYIEPFTDSMMTQNELIEALQNRIAKAEGTTPK